MPTILRAGFRRDKGDVGDGEGPKGRRVDLDVYGLFDRWGVHEQGQLERED